MLYLQDQVDQEIDNLLEGGEEVLMRIRKIYGAIEPIRLSDVFYMRSRIKTRKSIHNKMAGVGYYVKENNEIKGPGDVVIGIADIKDIVGLRFVTLYDDQLTSAIDIALDLIKVGGTLAAPIFRGETLWSSVREIKLYSRSTDEDEIYHRCHRHLKERIGLDKDLPEDAKAFALSVIKDPETPQSRYTSMHILCDAFGTKGISIPIEIQIRTAAEDIWGEVNHDMIYKVKHPSLWTEEADSYYKELDKLSRALNDSIRAIPGAIANIRDKYIELKSEFAKFCESDSADFTFSLVVKYIKIVACDIREPSSYHLERYREIFKTLDRRELDATSSLSTRSGYISLNRNVLEECLKQISGFYAKFCNQAKPCDKIAADQIRTLCEFEKMRIEALSISASMDPKKKQFDSLELYKKWKTIEYNGLWNLRPNTLMRFFDYFLLNMQEEGSLDRQRGIAALEDAYIAMRNDDSLAELSIYRFVIPYDLAGIYSSQATTIIQQLSDQGIIPFESGYQDEIAHHLLRALKYSLEAFKAGIKENNTRGDILLWRSGLNEKLDLSDTGKIVASATDFFGVNRFLRLTNLSPILIDDILKFSGDCGTDVIASLKDLLEANLA